MKREGTGCLDEKKISLFMILAAIALSVKYVFVDFGIDAEFQISMSYRLATGDIMFKEMWEPYQMSAFLCAFFIKLYLWMFDTTTGIVLYLQILGILIDWLVAYALFGTVKKYLNCPRTAFAMAWVFVLVSPKDVPLAEYANMQLWFSTLLCICLFVYYQTGKKRMVVFAALCLCGAVLSYPSCLILVFGVVFLLWHHKRRTAIVPFLAVCFLGGILYLCFIFSQVSVDIFITVVENMLALETSHSAGVIEKYGAYFKDILGMAVIFLLAYAIAYGAGFVLYRGQRTEAVAETRNRIVDALFMGEILLIAMYSIFHWQNYVRFTYAIVFVAIMLIGAKYQGCLDKEYRFFYQCATIISIINFVATLLLTNLELMASVPYLLIGMLAAFLPIAEVCKETEGKENGYRFIRTVVVGAAVLLLFRNGYIIRPMHLHVATILDIRGIVKAGPALGIISEYMGPYMQNETIKEWKAYIPENSSVYLIGGSLDTLGYLYSDTIVAAPSLVPTPGYNESVLAYWEMNPERYPDVIVASCWYGTMNAYLQENGWIMNWMEEEYQPEQVVDGKYWRYYLKNKK